MGSVIRSSLMLELAVTHVYIVELSFLKQYIVYSSVLAFVYCIFVQLQLLSPSKGVMKNK